MHTCLHAGTREYTHAYVPTAYMYMRIYLLHTCVQGGGGRRKYKYDSLRDLLRAVRNKKNHFDHLPPDLQTTMVCALIWMQPAVPARIGKLSKAQIWCAGGQAFTRRALASAHTHKHTHTHTHTQGPLPDGYLTYWTQRFPALLMSVHAFALSHNLHCEPRFRRYFP